MWGVLLVCFWDGGVVFFSPCPVGCVYRQLFLVVVLCFYPCSIPFVVLWIWLIAFWCIGYLHCILVSLAAYLKWCWAYNIFRCSKKKNSFFISMPIQVPNKAFRDWKPLPHSLHNLSKTTSELRCIIFVDSQNWSLCLRDWGPNLRRKRRFEISLECASI